ncbi:phasin family protein [Sphaerotilus hippei]|uniref:Phasin family protein n=1 Tax=Sphaerotilus hippei TaxID=744406 RepID=A0A318HBJ1_9BURK|nr:TIGR01841 family phasin [Sphaerotilus hippei]PXW98089.1 phasin family protein [Sphaerotilus hippei]
MITPEQFAESSKANLEALFELSQKTFDGVEKLVELNLQAVRATLGESTEHAKALLAAKDAQEVLALQSALLQPSTEKASSYGRQVYEIATSTQAEVTKLAEAQIAAAQQKLMTLVDTAAKNAPAGSENAVAIVKSAVTAANTALENVQKAAKQAVGAAEANFEAITQSATKAAEAASAAAPKVRRAPAAA